jgi:hypothetical protein
MIMAIYTSFMYFNNVLIRMAFEVKYPHNLVIRLYLGDGCKITRLLFFMIIGKKLVQIMLDLINQKPRYNL